MKKDSRGRKPLKILESNTHARILFLIADNKNYNQILSSELNTTPPATLEKINTLEKQGFVNSERLKKLNKKIYSINWYKIIGEFLNFLKQQKQTIFSEVEQTHEKHKGLEWLKQQLRPYDFSTYELLEDKEFLESTKNNNYLQEYFKEAFKEIGYQNSNITLKDFFRFLLMRELFIEVLEDMRLFMERIQEKNKDYSDFEKRHEREQEILNSDKDLNNLKQFCDLLYICRKSVILEFANNSAVKKIRDDVLFKHFPKEEVNNFLEWDSEHEQIFNENRYFARARKLLMFDKDFFEYKKNKLKTLKNDTNASKPKQFKHKEDSKK